MKKFMLYIGVFIAAYFIIQISSGILLTLFYTPTFDPTTVAVGSEAVIVTAEPNYVAATIVAVIAAAVAYGTTKLFSRKMAL